MGNLPGGVQSCSRGAKASRRHRTLITGDIYLQEYRDWIEKRCAEAGITALLPLWQINTAQLITDFLDAGFKAIIVSLKADIMDKKLLGRQLDSGLVNELRRRDIDPCGEAGEFHTFVYDGPGFQQTITIKNSTSVLRDDRWFLSITEYSLG